jgi:hypothetical protein
VASPILAAASRSSVNLARSRVDSATGLSNSPSYSTSPDPAPSSPEYYTFGHSLLAVQQPSAESEDNGELSDGPGLVQSPPKCVRTAIRIKSAHRATASYLPASLQTPFPDVCLNMLAATMPQVSKICVWPTWPLRGQLIHI